MTPEEVIQTLKGVLIVNRKEEEAVRYAVDAIRRLVRYKALLIKILNETNCGTREDEKQ